MPKLHQTQRGPGQDEFQFLSKLNLLLFVVATAAWAEPAPVFRNDADAVHWKQTMEFPGMKEFFDETAKSTRQTYVIPPMVERLIPSDTPAKLSRELMELFSDYLSFKRQVEFFKEHSGAFGPSQQNYMSQELQGILQRMVDAQETLKKLQSPTPVVQETASGPTFLKHFAILDFAAQVAAPPPSSRSPSNIRGRGAGKTAKLNSIVASHAVAPKDKVGPFVPNALIAAQAERVSGRGIAAYLPSLGPSPANEDIAIARLIWRFKAAISAPARQWSRGYLTP